MRDHSRDYYDDNYIDGRYPAVKAPAEPRWDEDYWDDDEDSGESAGYSRTTRIEVRGLEDARDAFYDDDGYGDTSSWELTKYMRSLPQRETTRRKVRSTEQDPSFEEGARAWRRDPEARRREETVHEEELTDGPTMPLTVVLLVTAALLTILAGVGRFRGYRNLDYDWRSTPLLSLVFSGLHDDMTPIAAITQDPATLATDDNTTDGISDGATSSDSENAQDGTTDAAEADSEQTLTAEDLIIPDGINDVVVEAVDYGICESRYLAAAGTTWETMTTGICAPNGTYYEPQSVDERYLEDALFIGDSRTDGLHTYGGIANDAYFWCKEALSIYDILDAEAMYYVPGDMDGVSMTLEEALDAATFRKVYISIGINELGTPDTTRFYNQYKELLSYVRERQPDAMIYIQGIMHVSATYSQSDSAFNNTNIVDKNTAIASLSNGRDIFYLDMNDAVCDENGNLVDSLSNDGLHLKASAYSLWVEDLLGHAFVRDDEDWTETAVVETSGSDGTGVQGTGKAESDISAVTGYIVQ